MSKLTLRHVDGSRVLPAYYSDNYVSLLPGEKRVITIECPESDVSGGIDIGVSGWNLTPDIIHSSPVSK